MSFVSIDILKCTTKYVKINYIYDNSLTSHIHFNIAKFSLHRNTKADFSIFEILDKYAIKFANNY